MNIGFAPYQRQVNLSPTNMQRGPRMNLRPETVPLRCAGHRFAGCTDSAFARANGNHLTRPPENTQDSLLRALRPPLAADWVETDVIRTADDHLVLCHATDITQHVEPDLLPPGARTLDELSVEQALALPIGADGTARLMLLPTLLQTLLQERPDDALVLNLELKDVQGTTRLRRQPPLGALILRDIAATRFPLSRLRFSSFSLNALAELTSLEPTAACAMLFDLPPAPDAPAKRLFADTAETYLSFTPTNIAAVLARLPRLRALHPEITTLTDATVRLAARHGLEIATWAWQEKSPTTDASAAGAIANAITLCRRQGVPLTCITDHIADVRRYAEMATNPE